MEQLDKVYSTFVNLEKNFARSTKTREEYLLDKCGGDFDAGPFLIMHYLNSQPITEPADVEKLSAIREILDKIQKTKGHHNNLANFNFLDEEVSVSITDILVSSMCGGSGVTVMTQEDLHKKHKHLHYRCTPDSATVTFLGTCKFYNTSVPEVAERVYTWSNGGAYLEPGKLYERRSGGRVEEVSSAKF